MDLFAEIGRLLSLVSGRGKDDNKSEALSEAQESLRQRFTELGSAYYAHIENGSPLPDGLIDKVRESVSQVQNMIAIQQRRRCPICGSAQEANARYCSQCGRPMPEETPELESPIPLDIAYCPQCGAMLEEGRVCALCGYDPCGTGTVELPAASEPQLPIEEPEDEDTRNE